MREIPFTPSRLHPSLPRCLWLACALIVAPATGWAAETVTLVLNWVPSAEHAPFFYAAEQGWYRDAGIELTIDAVAGSPHAIKRAAEQANTLAVSDFIAYLRTRGEHPTTVAIMALQPRSPYAIYYSARSGIGGVQDLAGKRIAAQPQDPMRGLWRVLARRNGSDASSVNWIALSNAAKPDALAAGEVDAALNPFLHNHLNYEAALGEEMSVMWWHELGFAGYGHVLVAGDKLAGEGAALVGRFVAATQRAWAQCLSEAQPCLNALLAQHPHLDQAHEVALWRLVERLYSDPATRDTVLGAFDSTRVDVALRDVESALVVAEAVSAPTTNRFLSQQVRVPAMLANSK